MVEVLYIIASYFIGTLMTAYLILRLKTGGDIRTLGSGNVGARNVGRLVGKKAFILTAIGDGLKGIVVVAGAKYLDFSYNVQLAVILAVVIGHIWPVFLRFKGGKGIATFIGALLAFDYILLSVFVIVFVFLLLLLRSVTLAAMTGFLTIPIIFSYMSYSVIPVAIATVIITIMITVHWDGIKEKLNKLE